MGKDSPSAPTPPDPAVVAAEQYKYNTLAGLQNAQLNRPDQVTDFGSSTWTVNPDNPDQFTQTVRATGPTATAQNNLLNQMNDAYATAIDPTAYGDWETLSAIPWSQLGTGGGGGGAGAVSGGGGGGGGGGGASFRSSVSAPSVGLDLANMPEITGMSDESRKRVEDAMYAKMTSRLDPRFAQERSNLAAQLAAQGITQGSGAYGAEQDIMNRSSNDAYALATNDAILTGGAEASRMMGDQLAHRGQIFNERKGSADVAGRNADRSASASAASAAMANQRAMWEQDRNDRLAQQSYLNEMTGVDFSNRTRMNRLQEAVMMRQMPAQDLAAMRMATNPNFGNTQSGANVQAAPYAQSAYNSYQGQQNAYNSQVGSDNAMMGGLMNLGSAAMMAPAGTFAPLMAAI